MFIVFLNGYDSKTRTTINGKGADLMKKITNMKNTLPKGENRSLLVGLEKKIARTLGKNEVEPSHSVDSFNRDIESCEAEFEKIKNKILAGRKFDACKI